MGRLSKQYQAVYRSIVDSRRINSVSDGAEALYFRLLIVSDDFGRYHGEAFKVCARALTARWEAGRVSPADVEERLTELERAGSLRRYAVDGEVFLEIIDYADPTADDRRTSKFPDPADGVPVLAGTSPCQAVPLSGTTRPSRACARVGVESESGVVGDVGVERGTGGDPTPPTKRAPKSACTLDEHLAEFEFAELRSDIVEAARAWSGYRRERRPRVSPWGPAQWRPALRDAIKDPEAFTAGVQLSIRQKYQGLIVKDARAATERLTTREASDRRHAEAWDQLNKHLESCSTNSRPATPLGGSATSATRPTQTLALPQAVNGSPGSTPR